MKTAVLRHYQLAKDPALFRSAVSLHSHTHYSRESLEYLPQQAGKIPLVGSIVGGELRAYAERNAKGVDFRRAWWTPPMSPEQVYVSERRQIEELGLSALVSITDHDAIDAGLALREQSVPVDVPVSVEWTVPVAGDAVHLGIHHLPHKQAPAIMAELARYTAQPDIAVLRSLLAFLAELSQTLVVLNHPCWDIARVGSSRHAAALREFFRISKGCIHALEVNGMRPTTENAAALRMGDELGLPTVAGGDRHGSRPNTVLNLSRASSFAEFVNEVRSDRLSTIVSLPAYHESLALRQLQTAADAVRRYPGHPHGQRGFTSRTFVELDDHGCRPLSFFWDDGPPLWLRPVLAAVVKLGSDGMKPLLHHTFCRQKERDLMVGASSVLSFDATELRNNASGRSDSLSALPESRNNEINTGSAA